MTHLIDTVHMLTRRHLPAQRDGQRRHLRLEGPPRERRTRVQVVLDYPQGFLCTYSSTLANGVGSGCRILGRKGTLEYEKVWRVSGDGVHGQQGRGQGDRAEGRHEGLHGPLHMSNWLECVRKGEKETHCTPEHGYQHAVACIMADAGLRTGRRMVFDEKSRTIREG